MNKKIIDHINEMVDFTRIWHKQAENGVISEVSYDAIVKICHNIVNSESMANNALAAVVDIGLPDFIKTKTNKGSDKYMGIGELCIELLIPGEEKSRKKSLMYGNTKRNKRTYQEAINKLTVIYDDWQVIAEDSKLKLTQKAA